MGVSASVGYDPYYYPYWGAPYPYWRRRWWGRFGGDDKDDKYGNNDRDDGPDAPPEGVDFIPAFSIRCGILATVFLVLLIIIAVLVIIWLLFEGFCCFNGNRRLRGRRNKIIGSAVSCDD